TKRSWLIVIPFQVSLEVAERAQARALILADPAVGDFMDRHGIEVVQLLAALPARCDEARVLENGEVLGHRLACHRVPFAEFVQCLAVPRVEIVQQLPPDRIGQRPEDRVQAHAGHMQPYGYPFKRLYRGWDFPSRDVAKGLR